jgi:hypothetical protein
MADQGLAKIKQEFIIDSIIEPIKVWEWEMMFYKLAKV